MDSNEILRNEIKDLKDEMVVLNNKMDGLCELLQKDVVPSCNKMGGHINFVENVYTNVKTPLQYIMDKTNYMLGNGGSSNDSTKSLPDVKDNK